MAPVMVGNSLPINKRLKELLVGFKWEHMAAGVSGGVMSTLVLHPLDLVKIRFQVNEGLAISTARPQYSGIANALVTIGRKEGLRGLYQGVTPNVWGAGASWGLYFFFYNAVKGRKLKKENVTVLSPGAHMLAAAEAGVFTLVITNPMWVAKTRLCLQYDRYTKGSAQYKGFADCLAKIYRQEGIRGWYKGFVPGMFGVSHGAIQFMTYEEMKKGYNKYKQQPLDAKFSTFEYLTFAALSKICAACTTYPYQVVRSRLQDQHRRYNGIGDVIKQVWRVEGWRGYYKGVSPYLVHVTPNICIVFLLYESITSFAKEYRARVKAEIAAERERIHQLQPVSSQCSKETVQCNEEEILDLSDRTNER